MERQPRRINDFFRKKCIRWTGGGGGSVCAVGVAGQKEWLKKNLLVAMDIRRVEYPGGFFVFFLYVRSHPSLLTRSTSDPAPFHLFLRGTTMYVACIIKTISIVSMAENYTEVFLIFFLHIFFNTFETRLINRSVLV